MDKIKIKLLDGSKVESGAFAGMLEKMKQREQESAAAHLAQIKAHSAYQFQEHRRMMDACAAAAREKAERERKAAEATIELNEVTKRQNELLLRQLKEAEAERVAAEKQSHEDRRWKWISLAVAIVSIAVTIVLALV